MGTGQQRNDGLLSDGKRKITSISEIVGLKNNEIVIKEIKKMLDKAIPEVKNRFTVYGKAKIHKIMCEVTLSEIAPLSADANTLDGLGIDCAIVDEFGIHKDYSLYEVCRSSQTYKLDAQIIAITTAYPNTMTSPAYTERCILVDAYEGKTEKDERYFACIYELDEEDKKNMMIKEILEVFPEKKKQSVERALEMKKMIDLFAELFLPDGEEGGGFRLSSLADISNLGSISNLKLLGSLLRSLDDDDDEEQDEEENKEYEYVEVENYDVDEEEIYNSEESFEDDYDEYLEVNKAVSNNKKYNKNKSRKKRSKKEKRNSKTNV